ncbi:hypothetical protein QVD17_37670 [Tagetes erecta]|uniref:Uncharacterized protein n=1 Tax=Tagetes erecta TaxID=13708 RepID=A0AAD8JX46_TARER|nr:hypothetical protein QVD17_37670 [Tagetes erecta]
MGLGAAPGCPGSGAAHGPWCRVWTPDEEQTLTISWYLVRSDPTWYDPNSLEFWNSVVRIHSNRMRNRGVNGMTQFLLVKDIPPRKRHSSAENDPGAEHRPMRGA